MLVSAGYAERSQGRDYKHDLEGRLILLDSFLYTHYPPIIKAHQMSMKLTMTLINCCKPI
jgi:hypothetical protein